MSGLFIYSRSEVAISRLQDLITTLVSSPYSRGKQNKSLSLSSLDGSLWFHQGEMKQYKVSYLLPNGKLVTQEKKGGDKTKQHQKYYFVHVFSWETNEDTLVEEIWSS